MGLVQYALCAAAVFQSVVATLEFTKNIFIQPTIDRAYYSMRASYFDGMNYLWVIHQTGNQSGVASIPLPLSNERKRSMSMMFWPFPFSVIEQNKDMPKCLTRLGQSMVPPKDIIFHQVELTHSYLYYERIRMKDPQGVVTSHFITVMLDKTSPSNALSALVWGNMSETKTLREFTCDNILQIRKTKFLIFCWKSLKELDLVSKNDSYKLQIATAVWSSDFLKQESNVSLLNVRLTETQYTDFKKLKDHFLHSLAIRSLNISTVEVALFFRSFGLLIVTTIQNDRFNKTIYPPQSSPNEKEIQMITLTDENKNEFQIYNIESINDYKFLMTQHITNFDQYDADRYPRLFYFDSKSTRPPVVIGKGMILSFKKALDAYSESAASEMLLIIKAEVLKNATSNQDNVEVTIQRRTFYEGYFYGSQVFKMLISGKPRDYRGVITKRFMVFVDYYSEEKSVSECGDALVYIPRLRVAPIERPDLSRHVMTMQKVVGIKPRFLVSPNHNLIWVRSSHKLEVFDLLNIGIDLSRNNGTLNMTFNNSEASYKLVPSVNMIYPEFEAGSVFGGSILHVRPTATQIFDITTNEKIPTTTNKTVSLSMFYPSEKHIFSGALDDIVSGNYLSYEANQDSPCQTDVALLEKKAVRLLQSTHFAKIDKLYSMDFQKQRFILVSFTNNKGNIVYKYNPTDDSLTQAMYFYDNRTVDSVQKLTNSKYLAHIQGLLYELDLEKLDLEPVFKSNDLCGELLVTVPHDTYGFVTVCAGRNELSIFISQDDKVDLSTPVNNLEIPPTLANMLKSEKVMLIISSYTFSNRFVTISMPENNTDLSSNRNWTTRVKIRVYEICSVKQTVEIIPEFEDWIYFKEYIVFAFAHIVQDRLIIFSSHGSGNFTKEVVRVLAITHTYGLVHDKTFDVPSNIRLNVQKHNPFSTILPTKKTLLHKTYGAKILLLASILADTEDIIENFDFFDYETYKVSNLASKTHKNVMAIFDPTQTSLDCIKLFELPDGHVPYAFGPYFVQNSDNEYVYGATIAGEANNATKVFFFNDHSLYLDLYSFKDLNSFFNTPKADNYSFSFYIKNYITNERRMINVSMRSKIYIEGDSKLSSLKDQMEIKLTQESNKVVKFSQLVTNPNNSLLATDLIRGSPYGYSFKYDSWIEMVSKQITGNLYTKVEKFPDHLVKQMIETVSYKPFFDQEINSFNISPLERIYKLQAVDFADLLFASRDITYPMVESASSTKGIAPNPHLSGKTRCTKFFLKDQVDSPVRELVACIALITDANLKMKSIDILIFDERSGKDSYKLDEPDLKSTTLVFNSPTSYLDLVLTSTLNHLVILYTVPNSTQSYRYEVFRVSNRQKASQFKCFSIISGDTWSTDLHISSSFYQQTDNNSPISERLCLISTGKLATLVLNYLCHSYKFEGAPMNKNLLFKVANIFEGFEYEDLKNVPIDLLLYEPAGNPVATDDMVVRDRMLYFIFSLPAHFSVFAKIDPDARSEASISEKGYQFTLLCNVFPGYKFAKEMHIASERYYAKVSVSETKSFISFFSLPPVYARMKLENYSPLYNESEVVIARRLKIPLKCIESKQTETLNFTIDDVRAIRFNQKDQSTLETSGTELDDDKDKRHVNTLFTLHKPSLIYDRFALSFLAVDGFDFYRVEFIPRFEVLSKTAFLLSDYLKIDIKGMHNSTAVINVQLISGKITELWFIFIYLLPVLIVAVLICLLNYGMNFAFTRIASSSLTSGDTLNSAFVLNLLSLVDDGAKKETELEGARKEDPGRATQSLKLGLPTKESLIDKSDEKEEKSEEQREMEMLLREACFHPITSKDLDYLEEIEDTESIRALYFDGILEVRALEDAQGELNQRMIEESRRPLLELVIEEESLKGVPESRMHDFKEFEEYMNKRKQEAVKKASLRGNQTSQLDQPAEEIERDLGIASLRSSLGHKSKKPESKPDSPEASEKADSESNSSDEKKNKKVERQTLGPPIRSRRQRR